MTNKFLNLAPLALIFALAGCAAHKEALHQAATQAAVQLSSTGDFQFVAACTGDNNGRSGVLSYSESTDQYRLQLVTGAKVDVIQAKQDPADNNAPFMKLNDHCYPK